MILYSSDKDKIISQENIEVDSVKDLEEIISKEQEKLIKEHEELINDPNYPNVIKFMNETFKYIDSIEDINIREKNYTDLNSHAINMLDLKKDHIIVVEDNIDNKVRQLFILINNLKTGYLRGNIVECLSRFSGYALDYKEKKFLASTKSFVVKGFEEVTPLFNSIE